MSRAQGYQFIWWERLAIIIFIGMYLIAFNVTVPHGDALRIVRQIEASDLIWNPNHLIFDPLGYYWYSILNKLGVELEILGSFELISAISTIISLIIFHAVLIETGINKRSVRVIAVVGLFASKNFLSLAVSQYYFMVQMPFLLGALFFGIRFISDSRSGKKEGRYLYAIGVLLAIATGLEINNIVLVFMLGLVAGIMSHQRMSRDVSDAIRLWGAAAAVGVPIFIFGYLASGADDSFFSWLLAYQGESDSSLDQHYGIQWGLKGIAVSLAGLGFNLFFGNIIETAGLGITLKVFVLQEPLEFIPEYTKISLAIVLMPVVGSMLLILFWWAIRHIRKDIRLLFLLGWISAYLIFNFYWTYGSDLFWFQILPPIWLMLIIYFESSVLASNSNRQNHDNKQWKLQVLSVVVIFLFVLNTLQTVMPISLEDIEKNRAEHKTLLRNGDLEIISGWDKYKWMMPGSENRSIKKLILMNMALEHSADEQHIQNLPEIVAGHLETGQRVIVARLFDLDHDSNPWYGLAQQGWPRKKIQALFSDYCNKQIGKIDEVVFREIYVCVR
ncbi:MAG: hypothetical protein KAS48_02890 [Gammaproteobacteria bacterium]|nr:hypothetical protein [Gammaproteobacteria bacterium]